MSEFEGWITVREAAKLADYHPDTIRELVREGKITARKFGTAWAVNRESLFAFLDEMRKRGNKRGSKPKH